MAGVSEEGHEHPNLFATNIQDAGIAP